MSAGNALRSRLYIAKYAVIMVGKSNFGLALFNIMSHRSSKNVTPNLHDYY